MTKKNKSIPQQQEQNKKKANNKSLLINASSAATAAAGGGGGGGGSGTKAEKKVSSSSSSSSHSLASSSSSSSSSSSLLAWWTVMWFVCATVAASFLLAAEIFRDYRPVFPLEPVCFTAFIFHTVSSLIVIRIGVIRWYPHFYFWQPFSGGITFICTQIVGYTLFGATILTLYLYFLVADENKIIFSERGALAAAGVLSGFSSWFLYMSIRYFRIDATTTTTTTARGYDDNNHRINNKKSKNIPSLDNNNNNNNNNNNSNAEARIASVIICIQILFTGAAQRMHETHRDDAAWALGLLLAITHILSAVIGHFVLGSRHVPGFYWFRPFFGSVLEIITQGGCWAAFGIAMFGFRVMLTPSLSSSLSSSSSSSPSSSEVDNNQPQQQRRIAWGFFGGLGVAANIGLLIQMRLRVRNHREEEIRRQQQQKQQKKQQQQQEGEEETPSTPPAVKATKMQRAGRLLFARSARFVLTLISVMIAIYTALLSEYSDLIEWSSVFVFGVYSPEAWQISRNVLLDCTVSFPVVTHITGFVLQAYNVQNPFASSLIGTEFVALQLGGWSSFTAALMLGVVTHAVSEPLWIAALALLSQILISASVHLVERSQQRFVAQQELFEGGDGGGGDDYEQVHFLTSSLRKQNNNNNNSFFNNTNNKKTVSVISASPLQKALATMPMRTSDELFNGFFLTGLVGSMLSILLRTGCDFAVSIFTKQQQQLQLQQQQQDITNQNNVGDEHRTFVPLSAVVTSSTVLWAISIPLLQFSIGGVTLKPLQGPPLYAALQALGWASYLFILVVLSLVSVDLVASDDAENNNFNMLQHMKRYHPWQFTSQSVLMIIPVCLITTSAFFSSSWNDEQREEDNNRSSSSEEEEEEEEHGKKSSKKRNESENDDDEQQFYVSAGTSRRRSHNHRRRGGGSSSTASDSSSSSSSDYYSSSSRASSVSSSPSTSLSPSRDSYSQQSDSSSSSSSSSTFGAMKEAAKQMTKEEIEKLRKLVDSENKSNNNKKGGEDKHLNTALEQMLLLCVESQQQQEEKKGVKHNNNSKVSQQQQQQQQQQQTREKRHHHRSKNSSSSSSHYHQRKIQNMKRINGSALASSIVVIACLAIASLALFVAADHMGRDAPRPIHVAVLGTAALFASILGVAGAHAVIGPALHNNTNTENSEEEDNNGGNNNNSEKNNNNNKKNISKENKSLIYSMWMPFQGGAQFVAWQATGFGAVGSAFLLFLVDVLRRRQQQQELRASFNASSSSSAVATGGTFLLQDFSSSLIPSGLLSGIAPILVLGSTFTFDRSRTALDQPGSVLYEHAEAALAFVVLGGSWLFTATSELWLRNDWELATVPLLMGSCAALVALPVAVIALRKSADLAKMKRQDAVDSDESGWLKKLENEKKGLEEDEEDREEEGEEDPTSLQNALVIAPIALFEILALLLCGTLPLALLYGGYHIYHNYTGALPAMVKSYQVAILIVQALLLFVFWIYGLFASVMAYVAAFFTYSVPLFLLGGLCCFPALRPHCKGAWWMLVELVLGIAPPPWIQPVLTLVDCLAISSCTVHALRLNTFPSLLEMAQNLHLILLTSASQVGLEEMILNWNLTKSFSYFPSTTTTTTTTTSANSFASSFLSSGFNSTQNPGFAGVNNNNNNDDNESMMNFLFGNTSMHALENALYFTVLLLYKFRYLRAPEETGSKTSPFVIRWMRDYLTPNLERYFSLRVFVHGVDIPSNSSSSSSSQRQQQQQQQQQNKKNTSNNNNNDNNSKNMNKNNKHDGGVVGNNNNNDSFYLSWTDPNEKPTQCCFGFAPHGVFAFTVPWLTKCKSWLTAAKGALPGHVVAYAANIVFNVPMMRDCAMWMGARAATRTGIIHAITSSHPNAKHFKSSSPPTSAMIVAGGQAELIETQRHAKTLRIVGYHFGFLKIAVQHRVPPCPVLNFGENDIVGNIRAPAMQHFFLRRLGFPFPILPLGVGGSWLPRKVRLTTVVGRAVDMDAVWKKVAPEAPEESWPAPKSEEESKLVSAIAEVYYEEMKRIFYKFRDEAGYPEMELDIIMDKKNLSTK